MARNFLFWAVSTKAAVKYLAPVVLFLSCVAGTVLPAKAQPSLDWVPRGMEEIGRTAAFHTDFTFDKTMLQVASGMMYSDDQNVQHAVAKLNGISVHSYRFAAPGMYDPRRLQAVREQYRAAGWQHLVSAESHRDFEEGKRTDLWINFQHMDVTGMVLLFEDGKNLNLIALSGELSPLDLLHLRGHFGIPRFSGDRFEPAPRNGTAPRAEVAPRYQAPQPQPAPGYEPAPGSEAAQGYEPAPAPNTPPPVQGAPGYDEAPQQNAAPPEPAYPAQPGSPIAKPSPYPQDPQ